MHGQPGPAFPKEEWSEKGREKEGEEKEEERKEENQKARPNGLSVVSLVAALGWQLGTPGMRELQWRNCLHQMSLWGIFLVAN